MQTLDKITIHGYKSIRQLDNFEIKPLNILIGANGVGKSNFISVFNLLNQIINENLQNYVGKQGGPDTFLHFGQKTTKNINIELWFGQNRYSCTLSPTTNDEFIFEEEWVSFHDPKLTNPLDRSLGEGHKETKLINKSKSGDKIAKYVLKTLKSWRIYHFHDTSRSAVVKQLGNIDDNMFFRPDASNLATYLYLLKETENAYYNNIVDTIKMVAPFFDNFILRASPTNNEKIRLEWKEKNSDAYFNANSLSDGTLRFMCLATLLLQPDLPSVILLDEPELGLHPYAINILSDLLQKAAKKTQIIVSTQSVTLVNQFIPEDIIIVDHRDNQSVFSRPTEKDIENWMDEYSLGELWEKNIIGGRPF